MWVSKWWPSFHFCVYYPFKPTRFYGVKAPIAKKEHNNAGLVQINKPQVQLKAKKKASLTFYGCES